MLEFINFCKLHYELIISCLTLFTSVLVFILRKKPVKVVDAVTRTLHLFCINAIIAAEKTDLKRADKLEYAVIYVLNALRDIYPQLKVDDYYNMIVSEIEDILSTPQKK